MAKNGPLIPMGEINIWTESMFALKTEIVAQMRLDKCEIYT